MSDCLLEAALSYAQRGWFVLPLHHTTPTGACSCGNLRCQAPGKHPRISRGFHSATKKPAKVHQWWKTWPRANIGIACKASGLVALDVDVKKDARGEESLRALIERFGLEFTRTVQAETPSGGSHYYYNLVDGIKNTNGKLGSGLETKVDAYVVAPPSVIGGREYRWIQPPETTPILTFPDCLSGLLTEQKPGRTGIPELEVDERIPEGRRNSTLTSLAGTMRRRGMSEAAIEAALLEENVWRCETPLSEDEVRSIARSVGHYPPADTTSVAVRDYAHAETLKESIAATPVVKVKVEGTEASNALKKLEAKVAKEGLLVVNVAEAYLEHRGYLEDDLLTLHFWKGDWWKWDGRKYVKLPTKELRADVIAFLGEAESTRAKVNSRLQGDVVAFLEGKCLISGAVEQPCWLDGRKALPAVDCISMENGILNIAALLKGEADCLKAHTPTFFSCVAVPYPFDPGADCPMWRRFLEEVLPNPEVRDLLQDFIGYLLTYDTSQHKFLMFEGDGRNGKSVVCEVMRAVLGEDNVSALPLEAFSGQFGLASTRGKLANIVEEISQLDKLSEGQLKIFVGGGVMTLDRKHREHVTVRATARLVFATNTRPRFADRSKGIWERLILIPFPVYIPEQKRDTLLARKLCQELPGIFNWAVAGLFRLRRRGRFVEPRVCVEAKEDYRAEANPARAFLLEHCEIHEGAEMGTEEVYSAYRTFCDRNGYKNPLGHAQFGKEVGRWFHEGTGRKGPKISRPRLGEGRRHVYEGIGFSTGENGVGQGGQGKSPLLSHKESEK